MPNSGEANVFYCPSCGASITMQGDQGICAFCGTAIERPADARQPPPPAQPAYTPNQSQPFTWVTPPVTIMTTTPIRAKRGCGCLGSLMVLIIVLATAFGIGMAATGGLLASKILGMVNSPSGLSAILAQIKLGSITKLAAVLPRDGKGGDLLVYSYGIDDSRYSLALIDGSTQAARWKSQPLSKEAYQGLLVAGRDLVYLTDQDQLVALHMTDGTIAWQAALDVEPQNGCDDCLRLVGSHVIVLEKNGGLQSFAAQTGKPAWSKRLDGTPRKLPVVGDRLVTTQPAAQSKDGITIAFLDAASGKATLEIKPQCSKPNQFSDPETAQNDTPFFFSADGKTLYLLYGFFTKCAQAFDLTSGNLLWDTPLDDKVVPSSWSTSTALLTEKELFIKNGATIWALSTADGSVRTVAEDKEYVLRPLALRDNMLIVLAAPTWDSQRQAIWGLDATTGERQWQAPLQTHSLRQGTSSGDWDWQITAKGLVVVQVLREDAQLIISTINLKTGTIINQQQTALTGMHSPSMYSALWSDDTAWLRLDSRIYAIDLVTGKPAYQL